MGVVDVVRTIKQIHPNDVVLVKIGKFYHAYGKDAYIVSFLFNYQLKKVEINTNTTGFPKTTINKVMKTLEDKSINYLLVDRSANYEVNETSDFKQKNTYSEMYNKAHKFQSRKNKADEIYEYLMSNIDDDIIKEKMHKIEKILYETR